MRWPYWCEGERRRELYDLLRLTNWMSFYLLSVETERKTADATLAVISLCAVCAAVGMFLNHKFVVKFLKGL